MSRFGLRAQLVAALTAAFFLAFTLLGVAAIQLGRRSRDSARLDDARATANTFAAALEQDATRSAFLNYSDAAIGHGGIRGVVLERPDAAPWTRGVTHLGTPIGDDGGRVQLWIRPPAGEGQVFGRLMTLYVSVTVGAILLLTFLALTRLIVRPVEAMTHAAHRMAAGRLDVSVPVSGALEVADLAASFNTMAKQLAAERGALERRLLQLETTTQELETAERQVERSAHLASVGRLAAGVAHEIGNPLTAIGGLVELAQDEDLPAEKRNEFLGRVESETARIQRIIRGLLDFARPGESLDSEQRVRLSDVVQSAVTLIAPQRDASRIRIEQRVEPECEVHGTLDLLTQVLLNLLLNAIDAVDGDGDILVEAGESPKGGVMLCITDSGGGIPEPILATLFEPFVTSKPVGKGTGLGLAVCHTIVERLGGTLSAQNMKLGARFEAWFPSPETPGHGDS